MIAVPERAAEVNGEPVLVRALTLSQRMRVFKIEDHENRMLAMLAVCVVKPDGSPMYSAEDWDRFGSTLDGHRKAMELAALSHELSEGDGKKT